MVDEQNGDVKTYLNYVGGEWVESSTGELIASLDPATGEVVAKVQKSGPEDMEKAIAAARQAFETADWSVDPRVRQIALSQYGKLLRDKRDSLAELLSRENGKTLIEAKGSIGGAIDLVSYYAGAARQVYGSSASMSAKSYSVVLREAVGVVGSIVPWNWPAYLLMRDLAPALAAGNAIVIKPASYTPAICAECIEILAQIKAIPKGIVNFVTGAGSVVGEVLAASEEVDMIAFTGDGSTGARITQVAAPTQKKLAMELGGKSPNIIFEDANLKKAIPGSIWAFLTTAGQVCMAGTRLIVQESIYDEVCSKLKDGIEKLKVGRGLEEGTNVPPLVAESQLETVMKYIEIGKREGKVLTGGHRLAGGDYDKGWFVAPTVFTDLPPDSRVVQEEVFGPVLVVQKFQTEEEAIAIANGTRYGLAGAVWTQNLSRAMRVSRKLKAGTVWINAYNQLFADVEFGGYKASGNGRMCGLQGLYEFTELKHLNFNP